MRAVGVPDYMKVPIATLLTFVACIQIVMLPVMALANLDHSILVTGH